jgi:hypothetical protein
MKYFIFFSWQSDTESKYNRSYIKGLLNDFAASISDCSIEIKESVGDSAGSPNIVDKVISEIDNCNIFVCDVTPITTYNNKKLPNPNVLFELGYAVCHLGWERIICIANESYGAISDMPFDIRQNRISKYKFNEEGRNKLELDEFILKIINEYEEIEKRFNSNQIKDHDTKVFNSFISLVDEKEFVDGLLSMRMNFIHTGYDKELWKRIIDFTNYPKNRYITESLNETFETFVKEVCIMKQRLGFITFPSHDWQCLDPLVSHTQDEIDNNLKEELFGLPNDIFKEDIPEDNDSYWDRIEKNQDEIRNLVDNVLKEYQLFRDSVKKYLFI